MPLGEHMHDAELVGVHDELLVGRGEAALHPAGGVKDEIRAGMDGRDQRLGALIGGLRIGDLGGAERAAGAERHVAAPGELAGAVDGECRFGRAEGRRARLHRERRHEGAEDHRRSRPAELDEGRSGEHLGEHLRQRSGDRHRAHRAGQDEGRHDHRLVGARIGLGGAEHGRIPDQRRVGVDQAHHHRVVGDELLAEEDLRHPHRVGGALRDG